MKPKILILPDAKASFVSYMKRQQALRRYSGPKAIPCKFEANATAATAIWIDRPEGGNDMQNCRDQARVERGDRDQQSAGLADRTEPAPGTEI